MADITKKFNRNLARAFGCAEQKDENLEKQFQKNSHEIC